MQWSSVRMGAEDRLVSLSLTRSRGAGAFCIGIFFSVSCQLADGDYFGPVPKVDPTHFRWCNSGEPEWVDPALTTSTTGSPIARLMFSGLTDMGMDVWGKSIPSIAHSWSFDDDLRRFTFNLRDDVFWSNGRQLTSDDFIYHVSRILHPTTLSRNVEPLKIIKNADLFNKDRIKKLRQDAPPFKKGDVVEIIGLRGEVSEKIDEADIPSSNRRYSTKILKLRDKNAAKEQSYADVPPNTEIDLVDISDDGKWSYVYYQGEMFRWHYGWVLSESLNGQPYGEMIYTVRELPAETVVGQSLSEQPTSKLKIGKAHGRDLLMTSDVLGIYSQGQHTLVIETPSPIPYILDITQSRAFRPTPRESVSRSPQKWTQPKLGNLVTSGPFTMTEWHVRDHMKLIKSQSHFDKDKVKVNRFTIFNIDEQSASANLYYTGQCDATTSNTIPTTYIPLLNGFKRGGKKYLDFVNEPYDGSYFYAINTEKISNVHYRRALVHGVDRSQIPLILQGGQIPFTSFVPGLPAQSLSEADRRVCGFAKDSNQIGRVVESEKLCYHPQQGLEFNISKAREELALAKEEMGTDFKNEIDAMYNIGVEGHKLVAEFLQREWSENLGLSVNLSTMEWKTYLEQTSLGNYELARYGWIGGTPHPEFSFHLYFLCDSPFNRTRWCNKEYDDFYAAARRETNPEKRLRLLEKAESVLLSEAPFVPLFIYTQQLMKRPYVKNVPIHMGDQPPLWQVEMDPSWRDRAH